MEKDNNIKDHECCGDGSCGDDCSCEDGHEHSHAHAGSASNPFANLDPETQAKIQQLQMLEQNFQQLLMQKNAFSMERNETDLVINEVEKAEDDVYRIVGNSVVIRSTKEKILEEAMKKQELIEKRMEGIDAQEKEFSEQIESIRDEVLKKIQG